MNGVRKIRLGVNIDHVATLRNLRNTPYPKLTEIAQICVQAGADQITVHLREDRRHINDEDVFALKKSLSVDLNLEMAATKEMQAIALKLKPYSVCLVPEKRKERTTEGGLDLNNNKNNLKYKNITLALKKKKILVSYFIEPNSDHVLISKNLGADAVEFHTGTLCNAIQNNNKTLANTEYKRLLSAIKVAKKVKLRIHAGHGIDLNILKKLKNINDISEYNIGHWIVCDSVVSGISSSVKKLKEVLS